MVELLAAHDGEQTYARYRDALQKEHDFWMEGSGNLGQGAAHRRVVRLPDGSILNRYWDDRDTPREESWREDVLTAQRSQRPAAEVYRNLRAAAESGWDFSSRWFADDRTLATIRTVDFVPVDLNSLLYRLEGTLAHAWQSVDATRAAQMRQAAERRRMAMHKYLWNESAGAFTDYDWRNKVISKNVTAAAGSALFFGVANDEQAAATAQAIERTLLAEYGIATTAHNTGEQWDAPNGWAPLQWIVIDGLHQYHHDELARKIATRWIQRNLEVFRTTGKLVEKYDVMSGGGAGVGGEYPLQDGFGWTNGVLRALLERYPQQ
jgi:alpha,alpha-trehalase